MSKVVIRGLGVYNFGRLLRTYSTDPDLIRSFMQLGTPRPRPYWRGFVALSGLLLISLLVESVWAQPVDQSVSTVSSSASSVSSASYPLGAQKPACSAGPSSAPISPEFAPLKSSTHEPIEVLADTSEIRGDIIEVNGHVQLKQGAQNMTAGQMAYNRKTGQANLQQGVEVEQPGLKVKGESASVNLQTHQAEFKKGEFTLQKPRMRGRASKITHRANGVLVLNKGQITTCEPDRESWVASGRKIKVDPHTHQGTAKDLRIDLWGLPIFYTPYVRFPVGDDRLTGLLAPTFGSSEGGVDITLPWYWNIAPNYDATLAPRYAEGRGLILETEWRYLNRYSMNSFNVAGLNHDKGGGDPDVAQLIADGVDEKILRPYKGENRWLMNLDHQGGLNTPWFSTVRYAKASDEDYLRDLSPETFSLSNSTFLEQSASMGYQFEHWTLSSQLQSFQNLLLDLDPSYRQLPLLRLDGRYVLGESVIKLNHEWVKYDHPLAQYITGHRAATDYTLEYRHQMPWLYWSPSGGVQSVNYVLDADRLNPGVDSSPNLIAPYFSFDSGLIFERKAGQQTLEPRIFYLYRQTVDHGDLYSAGKTRNGFSQDVNFDTTLLTFNYDQLFRARRFAGNDRIDDANQMSVGVTSTWWPDDRQRPLASLSAGQVIYFSDREVALNSSDGRDTLAESDLAAQATASWAAPWQWSSDLLYDPESQQVRRGSTGLEYLHPNGYQLRVDYRFVREENIDNANVPVEQIDTAFALPLVGGWQVMGRAYYDLDSQRGLDMFLGVEFDDCCYRLRVLARRWLDSKLAELANSENQFYDQGIFFEIELKGFTRSGDRIQQLLSDSLPGFGKRAR